MQALGGPTIEEAVLQADSFRSHAKRRHATAHHIAAVKEKKNNQVEKTLDRQMLSR
jgi:hypothetical protein